VSRKLALRWVFLLITGLAVGWELVASFDGSTDTEPWTQLLVDHVPAWVTFAAVGVLLLWLPGHFYVRYRRKAAADSDDAPG
jgi:hypothetical protein